MATPAPRLHHLDAARAALLLLGLPFHVATKAIFESDPAATQFQQSLLIAGLASVTHVFRMFAFFLLAGYFAAMIRSRKGTRAWLGERLRRLGLPFAASLFTLGALQFQLQASLLHKPSPRFLGVPLALDHLWFLIVLLALCAIYAMIPAKAITPGQATRRAMLLAGPQSLILLILLAFWGLIHFATELVPAIPDAPFETLLWQQLVFHAAGFALGVLTWHAGIGRELFALRSRWIVPGIVLLAIPYLPLDPLLRPALGKDIYPDQTGTVIVRALELPLAYLMSLGLFHLLSVIVRTPSRFVTFFVDGALAIYLFHLVWAMLVLPQVRSLPLFPELQWMLASAVVLALSALSYIAVRQTRITSILFCGAPQKTASDSPPAQTATAP